MSRKGMMQPINRPQSLTESVLERLREAIVSGEFALGSLLSERALALQLGVSKTPVREALAQLRQEGLVRIYPQRGAFVFSLSAGEVVEMCEFRQTLEAAALRLAMERHPDALVSDLDEVVRRMETARTRGINRDYLNADTAFHQVFFAHCGNGFLAETYALHVGKIAALRTHLSVKPLHMDKSFAEHRDIVERLKRGKVKEALGVLDVHIDRTKTTYSAEIQDIAEADRAGEKTLAKGG